MPMFGNPEIERQFDASETMGRRVFIIDQAVRDLEQTIQSTQNSQESAPVKNEIERLRQLRYQRQADLGIHDNDAVFDQEEYLQGLEKGKQDRQAELARREIINSQEFDQRAAA